MMPRFPGLSRVDSFTGLPWRSVEGDSLPLGHGEIPFNEPVFPPPRLWPSSDGSPAPSPNATAASVFGASMPDLVILPGQAATGGGGLSVGTLALLALVGVGGWLLWKKVRRS